MAKQTLLVTSFYLGRADGCNVRHFQEVRQKYVERIQAGVKILNRWGQALLRWQQKVILLSLIKMRQGKIGELKWNIQVNHR
jgi:hypothetical protein